MIYDSVDVWVGAASFIALSTSRHYRCHNRSLAERWSFVAPRGSKCHLVWFILSARLMQRLIDSQDNCVWSCHIGENGGPCSFQLAPESPLYAYRFVLAYLRIIVKLFDPVYKFVVINLWRHVCIDSLPKCHHQIRQETACLHWNYAWISLY